MSWSAITDGELTGGQLVLATTWKKLVDNPEAVCTGDVSVPLAKRILIESQVSTGAPAGAVLFGDASFAAFLSTLPISIVLPFRSFYSAGVFSYTIPVSGWYEITVQGGGGGGAALPESEGLYPLAASGASIRVHILLAAGVVLSITVGAGGAVGSGASGGASIVQGAAFTVRGGGSPNKTSGHTVPPLSGTTLATGVMTVVSDQPNQTTGNPAVHSSSAAGYGGVLNAAGHTGCVIIERISDNGL